MLGLLLLTAFSLKADVIGFIELENGVKMIVQSEKVGCHPVELRLFNKGENKEFKKVSIDNCEWEVEGINIKKADFSGKENKAKLIKLNVADGSYYAPIFGTTFMVENSAKVYFEDKNGSRKEINLGLKGGEIKGIKVMKNGIALFMNERATKSKMENGKRLYGISRTGKNKIVFVNKKGIVKTKKFAKNMENVYFIDIENNLRHKIEKKYILETEEFESDGK